MSKSSGEAAPQESAGGVNNNVASSGQKDGSNIYENRAGTKKIIRVVTVMAYVFSVSFAAILLSAYYVFLWEPPNPRTIQRHPLVGDPQAEYLTNNNLLSPAIVSDDDRSMIIVAASGVTEYERSGKKFEIQDDNENYQQKLADLSQNLLTYEDFLKFNSQTNDYSTTTDASTTLLKTTTTTISNKINDIPDSFVSMKEIIMPTTSLMIKKILNYNHQLNNNNNNNNNNNKRVNVSSENNKKSSDSSTNEEKENLVLLKNVIKNQQIKRNVTSKLLSVETIETVEPITATTESDISSSTDLNDLGTTINPEIYDYSYTESVDETLDNKVTIENYGTTDATTPQIPVNVLAAVPEVKDNNFEKINPLNQDSILSEDPEDDETTTTTTSSSTPEVQIYTAEKARDILNRK